MNRFLASVALFTSLISLSAFALPEGSLSQSFDAVAIPYFESGTPGTMIGKDDVHIQYRVFPAQGGVNRGALVVVSGRTEFMRKYAEFVYDLRNEGYTIYLYDHRGQGESDRMLADPFKGYVAHFQDYVDDLKQFMDQVVRPIWGTNVRIIAHSMGSATAVRYVIQNRRTVQSVVAVSPMFEANIGNYTQAIGYVVENGMCLVGRGEDYAPGRSANEWDEPFLNNIVTTSEARYTYAEREMERDPKLAVSGPTNRWVREAIVNGVWMANSMAMLNTPVLVFEAGNELVVLPNIEENDCHRSSFCQLSKIPGAKHEILMERDELRNSALSQALAFLKAH